MSENKEKSKFIHQFAKVMLEIGKTSGYIIADIFEVWATTSYKGVRMKEKINYDFPSYRRGLYNLKNRGLVNINGQKVSMTGKGRIWLKTSYLKHLRILHPKWDGKWRVVIFDIPQELHTNRNRFRRKLKSLGFFLLQKSVLVIPYPCEEDLAEICVNFKISDYVDVIVADSIGSRKEEVKRFFEL
ncbi:MAG: hypothetical protein HYT67_00145 [Candidatus Yanofskybacteria bacterium]|nr:hypothetical protein [Candidatus Yanofskybacteria bacterium]